MGTHRRDISYRSFESQDADDIKRMVDEAFSIHRYAPRPQLLHSALEVYLRECLAASTYAEVAVIDGRTVGVMMGRVAGQPRLPGRFRHHVVAWAHMIKLAITGFAHRRTLLQHFAFTTTYRNLRAQVQTPLTDELTLFAVDETTRGLGVGTALYERFLGHLQDHGRTDFYLYTDSWCTYQFYESRGMTRAAEQNLTLRFEDKPEAVGVYLYAGTAA